MRLSAVLRSSRVSGAKIPAAPPAVWRAFAAQSAWKTWTIAALLAVVALLALAVIRLATRPPEYVVVDADGSATFVRRGVATEPLLRFLADRTRPPELTVVRFTRDFLGLALGLHAATVEANWPAALALMSPELRERVGREAAAEKLVESYRLGGGRTELAFEDIVLVTRTPTLLHVRAVLVRTRRAIAEGGAPPAVDRVGVDLAERFVVPTLDRPDGLEVVEWHLEKLPATASASTAKDPSEVTRAP